MGKEKEKEPLFLQEKQNRLVQLRKTEILHPKKHFLPLGGGDSLAGEACQRSWTIPKSQTDCSGSARHLLKDLILPYFITKSDVLLGHRFYLPFHHINLALFCFPQHVKILCFSYLQMA
jgi:hypothetical protein